MDSQRREDDGMLGSGRANNNWQVQVSGAVHERRPVAVRLCTTEGIQMEHHVTATTSGTGPFYPAVKWNDKTWICQRRFDDEDKAAEFAKKVITQIGDAINEALTDEDFGI